MQLWFWRHATFVIETDAHKILVDPMLSKKDALDPVANCRNVKRIPMTELPFAEPAVTAACSTLDAVVVTHLHRDHWDAEAQRVLQKNLPIVCQPPDKNILEQQGFSNVQPVDSTLIFKELVIHRTGGQHGTGEIGKKMGPVSGFVIELETKKLYIAGDTIWCTEVQEALTKYKPDYIVLNAGAAQFETGDPITMTTQDIINVYNAWPSAKIIVVHMDSVNHCWLTREHLTRDLTEKGLSQHFIIPDDGEIIML